jgi:hypothetical protein
VHSIPQDQLAAALQAGGMPVATVRDPQGQVRYIPSAQVQTAQSMGGSVISRAPQSEELDFLQKNPGHTWLARDPQKFPNREEGIYPAGPGNEWRNDPNSPQATSTQAPIDLHLALHTYQGIKTGLMPVGAALSFGATIPQVVGAVAGGTAGNVAGQKIAEAAGAGPVGQEIGGDVGGLVGGVYAANRTGSAAQQFLESFRSGLNPNPASVYPGGQFPEVPSRPVLQASSLYRGAQPVVDPASGLGSIPVRVDPLKYPGAPMPASPTPELLQARGLTQGATVPPSESSDVLGQIPLRGQTTVAPSPTSTLPNPSSAAAATIPRTLSGDSALSQILSRLDNASLLRIARSRGIDVRQESLLKPGTANNLLINKIANDFSPDELQEFGARYLENSRFQHQFSNQMTPEAWSTVAMKSYFPDVKIPQTVLGRTQKAMSATDLVQQATKRR